MTRMVSLTGKNGVGKTTLVDDSDYENVINWKWHTSKGYPQRSFYSNGKVVHERMHHFIIGKPPKGLVVDHINGDKLDNRRSNLRFCTQAQNTNNRGASSANTSGYKGVSFHNNKWFAYISSNHTRKHIAYFDNKEEAAKAYDYYALKYHGEFAYLNFPDETPQKPLQAPDTKTSKYRGVHWCKKDSVYMARFNYKKKTYHVGSFKTENEAALAYNKKVSQILGDSAYLKLIDIEEVDSIEQLFTK